LFKNRKILPSPRLDAAATVVVWDLPLRLLHWMLAVSVLMAYFSANVFDTVHELAGYAALGLVALRLAWGFLGNRYSRLRGLIRPPSETLRYLCKLLHGRHDHYLGLNPAGAAMALTLWALLAIVCISGWMQITIRFFGVEWVELVHSWSSHLVIILVTVHVVGVVGTCVLQRENLVHSMLTGRKRAHGVEDMTLHE